MMEPKSTLFLWTLCRLRIDEHEPVAMVMYGRRLDDPSQFVRTSPVACAKLHPENSDIVQIYTANSLYYITGPGGVVDIPLSEATKMDRGMEPGQLSQAPIQELDRDGLLAACASNVIAAQDKARTERNRAKSPPLEPAKPPVYTDGRRVQGPRFDDYPDGLPNEEKGTSLRPEQLSEMAGTHSSVEGMCVKQTLHNWALIELLDEAHHLVDLLVWGEPDNRPPGRFKLTSHVTKIEEEVHGKSALVHTSNSVYRVVGGGSHYRFPANAFDLLAQGYSPDDVTKFHRLIPPEKSKGEGHG